MRPSSSTRLRSAILAIALVVALLPIAAEVTGNHGGRDIGSLFTCDRPVTPPRCTSVADDRRHLVYFDESLTPDLAASMRETMANDYGATRLVVIEQSRRTSATDVIAFSRDYGDNGAAGWVYCPLDSPQGTNPSGARWCRQQELHLNLNARYGAFFADDPSRDHVTCHEMGHTVGLRHWGNPPQTSGTDVGATCMNANNPDGPTDLHAIDVDHINAYSYRQRQPSRHEPLLDTVDPTPRRRLMPWSGHLEATEVEAPTSLEQLVTDADAVVRGEIVAIGLGRAFGDPASDDALHYAAATLRVDELLAGRLTDAARGELTLEIPLFDGPDSIDALPTWGEAVFILRNKGTSAAAAGLPAGVQATESMFYRLSTFGSIVVRDGDVARTDPGAPLLADLDGRPFGQALAILRRAGR